ncbi:DegT/DnrJ/EryC1/StrS family aminotransferase [Krasilnikovia sp. MM14-A1259]
MIILDNEHVLVNESDHAAVREVLDSLDLSGTGSAVAEYEDDLAFWFGVDHAIACSSGTAALHLALLALDVAVADEVIIPATAPVMTAMPVLAVGATPVFVDVATSTSFALDHGDLATKITPQTRAIIAVPMWGYPADGPDLVDVCKGWGIPIIEDAAQAHGTMVAEHYVGTRATVGCFSTHNRKLLSTGEGGFCLTADPAIAQRLRELRNVGKRPGEGFGAVFGLNYKLPSLSAALGRSQLARLGTRVADRRATLRSVTEHVAGMAGLEPFPIRSDGLPNGYSTLFRSSTGTARPIAERLGAAGVASDPLRYGYKALYQVPALARHAPATRCANAERLIETVVTIPCHEGVGPQHLGRIAAALRG